MRTSLPLSSAADRLRELIWVGPVAAVGLGLVAGDLLAVSRWGAGAADPLLVSGSASDVRTLVVGILSGLITALTVVFSLTLVAIQTAGTNYGPRLLRNYLRDGVTQWTLALLLGTVAYCLGLLLGAPAERTPRLAATVALALTVASIGGIAYFLGHIAASLRVEAVLGRVVRETLRTIDQVVDRRTPALAPEDPTTLPLPPPGAAVIASTRTGHLQQVDRAALDALVDRFGVHLRLLPARGEQVVEGAPLAWVWPGERVAADPDALSTALQQALDLGFERTLQQDIGFGFRQIVDLGIKAISPAVNDPFSAVQAIDSLEQLLVRLAPYPLGPQLRRTPTGHLVALPALAFGDYLALACDQLRRNGADEPAVVARLLVMLRTVAAVAPGLHNAALHAQVEALLRDAARETPAEADLVPLRALAEQTCAWIDGDLAPRAGTGALLL